MNTIRFQRSIPSNELPHPVLFDAYHNGTTVTVRARSAHEAQQIAAPLVAAPRPWHVRVSPRLEDASLESAAL